MKTFFPVSIITHGLALNITVQTYCGSIDFGIVACKEAVPDLNDLGTAIEGGFGELVALAQAKQALEREREAAAQATTQPSAAPTASAPSLTSATTTKARSKPLARKPPVKAAAKATAKATAKAAVKVPAKRPPAKKPTDSTRGKPLSKRSSAAG
jgi:diacylglycerol O-acyltransferase